MYNLWLVGLGKTSEKAFSFGGGGGGESSNNFFQKVTNYKIHIHFTQQSYKSSKPHVQSPSFARDLPNRGRFLLFHYACIQSIIVFQDSFTFFFFFLLLYFVYFFFRLFGFLRMLLLNSRVFSRGLCQLCGKRRSYYLWIAY